MKPFTIVGMFLLMFGFFALAVRSVTYFTTDTVTGPLGFFAWDVSQPHTVFINPLAGILSLACGIILLFMDRSTART